MTSVRSNQPLTLARTVRATAAPSPKATVAKSAGAKPAVAGDQLVLNKAPRQPQPTKVRLNALDQMSTDRPSFGNPDEYKNYVIKFTGYIKTAKGDMQVAQEALDAETQKKNDASANFVKPLNAAKKVLSDTENLYQGPIDRISGDLGQAKADLDDAIYPGKKKAAELDAQAQSVQNEIDNLTSQLSQDRSRVGSLEADISNQLSRRSSAESDRSSAESEISRLQYQAPSQSSVDSQRQRVNDAASRLQAASDRVSTANSHLSRARELQSAISTLSSIQSGYQAACDSRSSLKSWVTRKQSDLDKAQASGDAAKITAAKSAYDEELAKYNAADEKVRSMESQMSSNGASPSTIGSVIASKKSELSQYSNAQSEYDSAVSAKQSAQSSYDSEKNRLDSLTSLLNQLNSAINRRDSANRTINEANARLSSDYGQKSQLNNEIPQLQSELDTKTRSHDNLVSQANQERARQNPPDHPQVVAARARVNDLSKQLNDAQATYNEKVAGPKAKVDQEQKTYNDNMAPYIAKVGDAQRGVDAAKQEVDKVQTEFDNLKNDIGWWKRTWWKLRYHFDVNQFWKDQGANVAASMAREVSGLK